jgi:hypothetical protein
MKKFLAITSTLLIVALIAGVGVWFLYQRLNVESLTKKSVDVESTEVPPVVSPQTPDESTSAETPPVVLTADSLSEGQRAILTTFGLGDAEVVVTDAVIRCAEDAVGEERFVEILAGGAPSPREAFLLLPCMKAK